MRSSTTSIVAVRLFCWNANSGWAATEVVISRVAWAIPEMVRGLEREEQNSKGFFFSLLSAHSFQVPSFAPSPVGAGVESRFERIRRAGGSWAKLRKGESL